MCMRGEKEKDVEQLVPANGFLRKSVGFSVLSRMILPGERWCNGCYVLDEGKYYGVFTRRRLRALILPLIVE